MINLKDAHLKPQPMPDADSDIYWRGIQVKGVEIFQGRAVR